MVDCVAPGYWRSDIQNNLPLHKICDRVLELAMWTFNMQHLIHWFASNGSVLAVLVTVGVAILLVCCLGCANCPKREKDDLFRRREV